MTGTQPMRATCLTLLLLLTGCGAGPAAGDGVSTPGVSTPGWVRLTATDLSVDVPATFERITDGALGPREVAARSGPNGDQPRVLVQVGYVDVRGQDPARLAAATRRYDRAAAQLAGATVDVRRVSFFGQPTDAQVWSGSAPGSGGPRLVHVQALVVRGAELVLLTGQGPDGDAVRQQLLAITNSVRPR